MSGLDNKKEYYSIVSKNIHSYSIIISLIIIGKFSRYKKFQTSTKFSLKNKSKFCSIYFRKFNCFRFRL